MWIPSKLLKFKLSSRIDEFLWNIDAIPNFQQPVQHHRPTCFIYKLTSKSYQVCTKCPLWPSSQLQFLPNTLLTGLLWGFLQVNETYSSSKSGNVNENDQYVKNSDFWRSLSVFTNDKHCFVSCFTETLKNFYITFFPIGKFPSTTGVSTRQGNPLCIGNFHFGR